MDLLTDVGLNNILFFDMLWVLWMKNELFYASDALLFFAVVASKQ